MTEAVDFKDILAAIKAMEGGIEISCPTPDVFPFTAQKRREEEKRQEMLKILSEATPGQMIEGEGVYIGQWTFKDRSGKKINKIFNVFAAPEDLTDELERRTLFKYVEAVERVAALKNWHGFNGIKCAHDTAFYSALQDGSYHGEWVIPPCEVLSGRDAKGNRVEGSSVSECYDQGVFEGTFNLPLDTLVPNDFLMWYWSCSESRDKQFSVWAVKFAYLDECAFQKTKFNLSCRPIRLKEVQPSFEP